MISGLEAGLEISMAKGSDPLWIEHAHFKKGAERKATGTPKGKNIKASALAKEKKKGGKAAKRANAATTLKRLAKRK